MFSKYLSSLGLTIRRRDMVRLGEAVEAQALAAGSIDGVLRPNRICRRFRQMDTSLLHRHAHTARTHYAVLVFGPKLTITHRDVGQRFVRAYLRSVKTFNEELTARNVEIMASRTGVEADRLRKICPPTVNRDGELDFPSLLEFQKWLVGSEISAGFLEQKPGRTCICAQSRKKEIGFAHPGDGARIPCERVFAACSPIAAPEIAAPEMPVHGATRRIHLPGGSEWIRGKSTLLRILAGLLGPTSGKIVFGNSASNGQQQRLFSGARRISVDDCARERCVRCREWECPRGARKARG